MILGHQYRKLSSTIFLVLDPSCIAQTALALMWPVPLAFLLASQPHHLMHIAKLPAAFVCIYTTLKL